MSSRRQPIVRNRSFSTSSGPPSYATDDPRGPRAQTRPLPAPVTQQISTTTDIDRALDALALPKASIPPTPPPQPRNPIYETMRSVPTSPNLVVAPSLPTSRPQDGATSLPQETQTFTFHVPDSGDKRFNNTIEKYASPENKVMTPKLKAALKLNIPKAQPATPSVQASTEPRTAVTDLSVATTRTDSENDTETPKKRGHWQFHAYQ